MVSSETIHGYIVEWNCEHPSLPEIEVIDYGDSVDEEEMLNYLRRPFVKMAVLGQNRAESIGLDILRLNRKIFDRAVCDSVLIRLGERQMEECETVLIPSAGGPHSCLALCLGSQIADRFEGTITPLYVEPEIGQEDGEAVGYRVRDSLERFFQLRVSQLERESRIALFDRLQIQSEWSFDFMASMTLATGIAALGLVQNSPAVVIGAMLVAPLLGSGLSLVQGSLPLMRTCLRTIFWDSSPP